MQVNQKTDETNLGLLKMISTHPYLLQSKMALK